MTRCFLVAAFALLLAGFPAAAQDLKPERTIRGTTLNSQYDPPIHIGVPDDAAYVGADRWVLYGLADTEIHLFVDAAFPSMDPPTANSNSMDAEKKVRRYWWIQFESTLPDKHATHEYSDPVMDVDGYKMFVRARFGPSGDTGRPGSDAEHVLNVLTHAGYTLPAEMMNVRFVSVLDEAKRKELMIVYAEAMPEGVTSAALVKDGKPTDAWAPLEHDLIARARESLTLRRMD